MAISETKRMNALLMPEMRVFNLKLCSIWLHLLWSKRNIFNAKNGGNVSTFSMSLDCVWLLRKSSSLF